jgi:flavin-dependent dehydrogenase
LIEPWTREGISFALRSGKLAGDTAAHMAPLGSGQVANLSAQYTSSVEQLLGPEIRAGRAFMKAFTKRPWLFHAAIGIAPTGWNMFVSITSGGKTFNDALGHWPMPLLLKVAALDVPSVSLLSNPKGQS